MTKVIDVEEVGMVHVPKQQSDQSKAYVSMEAGKSGLDTLYDHYQKKIYIFDRSGSMAAGMQPEDEVNMYLWTPETLEKFRKLIVEDLEAQVLAGITPADIAAELAQKLQDDQALKLYVVDKQLHLGYDSNGVSLEPPRDPSYTRTTERKMEAVRGARKMIGLKDEPEITASTPIDAELDAGTKTSSRDAWQMPGSKAVN